MTPLADAIDATELTYIPVVLRPREFTIIVTDDLRDGFHWSAHRGEVPWALGWTRTRDPKKAELHARNTAAAAYADFILNPMEQSK